jgi:D-glycero-D-manno-heptose 1,7-bisphosphate phosphatase
MLQQTLGLDAVRVCPHDNSDGCDCRKPLPGLMTHAAEDFGIDLGASFVVGDRWRDVEAGKNAGCRTVFIDCNYDEALKSPPDHIATSLLDAAAWIARTA